MCNTMEMAMAMERDAEPKAVSIEEEVGKNQIKYNINVPLAIFEDPKRWMAAKHTHKHTNTHKLKLT